MPRPDTPPRPRAQRVGRPGALAPRGTRGGPKQGRKRSVATDAAGIPLGLVATRANRNDSPLLDPTLHAAITQVGAMPAQITAHLDRGYEAMEAKLA